MGDDGYPTDEELDQIQAWSYRDPEGWFVFIKSVWWAADWGWSQEGKVYRISTGGWSGNEEIIEVMQKNQMLWMQTFESMNRGGHYVFQIGLPF